MGWSCSKAAMDTLEYVSDLLRPEGEKGSNSTKDGFWETSRVEHLDGAITGTVWKLLPDGEHCRKAGSFRINGNGQIVRWPGLTRERITHINIKVVGGLPPRRWPIPVA